MTDQTPDPVERARKLVERLAMPDVTGLTDAQAAICDLQFGIQVMSASRGLLTTLRDLLAHHETAVAHARRDAFKQAAQAADEAAWRHAGDDAYSQGMDRGAREQVAACDAAIRALAELDGQEGGEG